VTVNVAGGRRGHFSGSKKSTSGKGRQVGQSNQGKGEAPTDALGRARTRPDAPLGNYARKAKDWGTWGRGKFEMQAAKSRPVTGREESQERSNTYKLSPASPAQNTPEGKKAEGSLKQKKRNLPRAGSFGPRNPKG